MTTNRTLKLLNGTIAVLMPLCLLFGSILFEDNQLGEVPAE